MSKGHSDFPEVQALKCSACGAPVERRAPDVTERVAGSYCGSSLDAKDPALAILQKFDKKLNFKPMIPLGKRGFIRGEQMECLGVQCRQVTVEGVKYEWREYLLYNPFKGFRFLSEYHGHWSYIKVTRIAPKVSFSGSAAEQAEYLGKTYRHFQRAKATTVLVLGEFYWEVQVPEVADCTDFVCPPYLLSREQTSNEITWSIGEYLSPAVVWKAFQLPGSPVEAIGVGSVQPWVHEQKYQARMALAKWLLAALFAVQLMFWMGASNQQLHSEEFEVKASDVEKSRVTQVFDVPDGVDNLEVSIGTNLDNNWVYLAVALVNEETGNALDFARDVEYYHGSDSDGAWSEGGRDDSVVLPSVPGGKYYLRLEPEAGAYPVFYRVAVTRDVRMYLFFMLALLVLAAPMAWLAVRRRNFEYERWLESDHPMKPLAGEGDN